MRPMTAEEIRAVPVPDKENILERTYADILSWQLMGRNSIDLLWGPNVREEHLLADMERDAPGLYESLIQGGFTVEWIYRFTLNDNDRRYCMRISW